MQGFSIVQDAAIELKTLGDVKLVNGFYFEEFDVEWIAVLVEAFLHFNKLGAVLLYFVGDSNSCHCFGTLSRYKYFNFIL